MEEEEERCRSFNNFGWIQGIQKGAGGETNARGEASFVSRPDDGGNDNDLLCLG